MTLSKKYKTIELEKEDEIQIVYPKGDTFPSMAVQLRSKDKIDQSYHKITII